MPVHLVPHGRTLPFTFVLLALLGTGCGGSTEPGPPRLSGTWTGTVVGYSSFTLELTESRSGQVSGNWRASWNCNSSQCEEQSTVSGTHAHPDVTLTFSRVTSPPATFVGRLVGDQMSGKLGTTLDATFRR